MSDDSKNEYIVERTNKIVDDTTFDLEQVIHKSFKEIESVSNKDIIESLRSNMALLKNRLIYWYQWDQDLQ